eukprot:TRINITY_DN43619_c0_g1_i1.p1 TRINITY_DN43619_c0_g1~~TRINITY_DN43619_c0_g1_i1.p1  ORF type:complete len:437 (+),score=41.98 TRINITY_DN43619_c0_g1_i1:65-1375(+)
MPNVFVKLQHRRSSALRATLALDSSELLPRVRPRCRSQFIVRSAPFAAAFVRTGRHCDGQLAAIAEEGGRVTLLDGRQFRGGGGFSNSPIASDASSTSGQISTVLVGRAHLHDNAIFDVEFAANDTRLVTAAGDRSAGVFDVEAVVSCGGGVFSNGDGRVQPIVRLVGHGASVRCARANAREPELVATSGRDGHIAVWDLRAGACNTPGVGCVQPVAMMRDAHIHVAPPPPRPKRRRFGREAAASLQQHSVPSVHWLPCSQHGILSVGASDGCLKLWDIRCMDSVETVDVASTWHEALGSEAAARARGRARGLSHVEVGDNGHVICSCLDGSVYVLRLGDLHLPPARLSGHQGESFEVRAGLSRDSSLVSSGSCDSNIYIWRLATARPGCEVLPLLSLQGHTCEVTSARWGPGFGELVSVSDDGTARFWGPSGGDC